MTDPHSDRPHTDRWLSLLAAGLVLGVITATIIVWITAPTGPAQFTITTDAITTAATPQRIDVEVTNTGGTVATDVVVRATFTDGTETDQTLAWISPGETAQLVFYPPGPDIRAEIIVVSYVPDD